jgi:hypothetical protein
MRRLDHRGWPARRNDALGHSPAHSVGIVVPARERGADICVEGGGNTIVINQVRLVLGEIELGLASADCSDSGHGGSGNL